MDKVKIEESKQMDWTQVQINAVNDMDNLVNFAKRAPIKLRKIWQKNYYI